jgi:2-C-methyl-D-erythritol 4-phosphate cytidylyltransferase
VIKGSFDVVIVAAGTGERFGSDVPKQFLDLGGAPLLAWSIDAFRGHPGAGQVLVVLSRDVVRDPPAWLAAGTRLVEGGPTRGESVRSGVQQVRPDAEVVLVHDGVRPFVSMTLIDRVYESARQAPTIPTLPVTDTVKELDGTGRVVHTVPRARLRLAQTPQGLPASTLRELYAEADTQALRAATDDASLCEGWGIPVRAVEGDPLNLKVTAPGDLEYARWLVERGIVQRPRM